MHPRNLMTCILALATVPVAGLSADGADADMPWKAGVASAVITPQERLHMAGYAGRKEPAEGAEQQLFAKALAIEDEQANRVVFVTLDLIGVTEELRAAVAQQAEQRFRLPPAALVMNASHTHCGPAYGRDEAKSYLDSLTKTIVNSIGQALEQLQPASLYYCYARCGFAINRRTPTDSGFVNHPNPDGLVDHTVPVLRVADAQGELRAVLFGYACHNTTMGFLRWLGDYAGYAQEFFEQDHPEVTALFMMGCGGDQNPYPRSELRYAKLHGRSLATAVEAAIETNQRTARHQRPLRGPLQCVLDSVDLEFKTPDRPDYAYPVQLIQFGKDLTIIALGSEVVVDYSLRLKDELHSSTGPAIWVAGYSNAYSGYIPSRRVLLEGGYEARSRPWQPSLEERIVKQVKQLFGELND